MIEVREAGRLLAFSFEDLRKYHGGGSPGGVAHAYKVMERAWPLLGAPLERREIRIETAFPGPGARDAFEMATRAVSDGRYHVDPALGRPARGRRLERFVFRLTHRDRTVTLLLREGFVVDEFVDLLAEDDRSADQAARLEVLKQEMADRVMAAPAPEVYEPG